MHEIYKDKAGNRILKDPWTNVYEARNAEGKLVGKKGFETLAKRAGFQGLREVKGKKTRSIF